MSATDKVAKIISDLTKQISSKTRAAQLGNSSVRILTGDELLIGDVVETATDTSADLGSLMDYTERVSDIADGDANNLTLVPEWLVGVGDTGDLAFSVAAEAGERVTVALEEAEKAAQDAANALTTANGKNSRRRGVTKPAPPEGGWVQGDQWVRDIETEPGVFKPVEVLVWNGTAFVSEQIIANEILVFGENGNVRIKDGEVTANTLSADALNFKKGQGMEIIGGKITGGEISLANILSTTVIYEDDCEALTNWSTIYPGTPVKPDQVKPSLSTTHMTGSYSIKGEAIAGVAFNPPSVSKKEGNVFEAWVRTNVTQRMYLSAWPYVGQENLGVVQANTWQKIRIEVAPAQVLYIGFRGDIPGTEIYVDKLSFSNVVSASTSGLKIHRDSLGIAQVESYTGQNRARLHGGKLLFDDLQYPGIGAEYSSSGMSLHSKSVMDNFDTSVALSAGGFDPFIWIKRGDKSARLKLTSSGTLEVDAITKFNGGIASTELTDWNDATAAGFYSATNAANGPTTGWYTGTVTKNEENNRIFQEVREARTTAHDTVHRRYWNGSSWTPWITDGDRDLFVRRSITGLTWPGSGNGWYWTAPIKVNFPAGKFSQRPYMGTPHVFSGNFLLFSMVTGITDTSFDVRVLKYGATALTSCSLEYSAYER